jgi:uncharacterized glyoxalase superfamily protein PhnB
VFGFAERLRIGNHRVQLVFGGGSIVVIQRSLDEMCFHSNHGVMVRVDDVDAHCARTKAAGANVVCEPADYPYGERQYSVVDIGGHRWTFSQSIADVDPASWGGELVENA